MLHGVHVVELWNGDRVEPPWIHMRYSVNPWYKSFGANIKRTKPNKTPGFRCCNPNACSSHRCHISVLQSAGLRLLGMGLLTDPIQVVLMVFLIQR